MKVEPFFCTQGLDDELAIMDLSKGDYKLGFESCSVPVSILDIATTIPGDPFTYMSMFLHIGFGWWTCYYGFIKYLHYIQTGVQILLSTCFFLRHRYHHLWRPLHVDVHALGAEGSGDDAHPLQTGWERKLTQDANFVWILWEILKIYQIKLAHHKVDLPYQVKTQYLHIRWSTSYFLLPWKKSAEMSRRSILFHS